VAIIHFDDDDGYYDWEYYDPTYIDPRDYEFWTGFDCD
jgi:hypothetical protein